MPPEKYEALEIYEKVFPQNEKQNIINPTNMTLKEKFAQANKDHHLDPINIDLFLKNLPDNEIKHLETLLPNNPAYSTLIKLIKEKKTKNSSQR